MIKSIVRKMRTSYENPISYHILDGETPMLLNDLIGKHLQLTFTGQIFCQECNKKIQKAFGEGFCFSCFSAAAAASPCILRPELCQAHLGLGRDPDYEQKHHNQPHLVYLALTDQIKVGVTRQTQMPTRWIDQGAAQAIVLAQTPNRYLAGVIEVALKDHFSDKTNWQNMLRNIAPANDVDLAAEKWELEEILPQDLTQYWTDDEEIWVFNYPVKNYPAQVKALNFDKEKEIQGILTGIRGQYLYFDGQFVLNLRRHTGYEILWQH